MTQEKFESSITRDAAIQERCRTIRAVCLTTIVAGVAATTILNTALAIKGFKYEMKKYRKDAAFVGTYTVKDDAESI